MEGKKEIQEAKSGMRGVYTRETTNDSRNAKCENLEGRSPKEKEDDHGNLTEPII